MRSSQVRLLILIFLVGALLFAYRLWWRAGDQALVVYCAHDQQFAEVIFAEFRRRTGIAVSVRYDSEATKSLGLVERLMAEAEHGPCDVFWNNEQLGTIALQQRGLLADYRGSGWQRLPNEWRHAEGQWSAFAARLRVIIINTARMPATTAAVRERLAGNLSRVAIAKPLFGTTLTHYSTWWSVLGSEPLKKWHQDSRTRGIRECDGNGMVKALVAAGTCDFGFTDTDDYFAALDAGASVAMIPARLADIAATAGETTILIPNTVAMMRHAPHRSAAELLVDFLLSAEGELLLARSASRQIPLGRLSPAEEQQLPPAVRELREAAKHSATIPDLSQARESCLLWLKQEYTP